MENKENNKKLWFKRKKYGYGWTPSTIQGWLVVLVYLFIVIFLFRVIDVDSHSASDTLINFVPLYVASTILLLVICMYKGEKPKWTWGDKK